MEMQEKTVTEAASDEPLKKSRYHHGDLRAGLIEATRRLVEERGPDGFSVTDACKLAGVSTAAPYKHFKDKNDMLVAVVMGGMVRLKANMDEAVSGLPKGSIERVNALGREYVRFAREENGVFRLKFGGYTDRLDDPRLQAAGEATFDTVLVEVAACLGEDEITPEVRKRGFMLWSFVHGLSFLTADDKLCEMAGVATVDDMIEDLGQRMLRA